MRTGTRIILVAVVLTIGYVVQTWLAGHVQAAGPMAPVPLRQPLHELPLVFGEWQGVDVPIEDPRFLYADDHLKRTYYHPGSGQTLSLWMAYSAHGEDRRHHPEVCMAVAGKPEDKKQRQTLFVEGHAQPIQQYCFGQPGQRQWVFYWHYTLRGEQDKEWGVLQRIYQKVNNRPSSLTIEVFAPERTEDDLKGAQEFVKFVDAAVGEHVGPHAVRGSRRMPVTVIDDVLRPAN